MVVIVVVVVVVVVLGRGDASGAVRGFRRAARLPGIASRLACSRSSMSAGIGLTITVMSQVRLRPVHAPGGGYSVRPSSA